MSSRRSCSTSILRSGLVAACDELEASVPLLKKRHQQIAWEHDPCCVVKSRRDELFVCSRNWPQCGGCSFRRKLTTFPDKLGGIWTKMNAVVNVGECCAKGFKATFSFVNFGRFSTT